MNFYGKAETAAQKIIETFKGGKLPETLADIFIKRNDNIPSRKWSWNNQFLMAIAATSDARGFGQWKEVGRKVKKESKAFHILAPCMRKSETDRDANGKPKMICFGFRVIPVFRIQDTEVFDSDLWEKHNLVDADAERFLDALPLKNVAEKLGLTVTSYSGKGTRSKGWYCPTNRTIGIGVENFATWAHELVHAADDRLGNMTERGQHWRSECVAEFGSAALLLALGYETDADLGGAWSYIEHYAMSASIDPTAACLKVLNRTCDAVNLILETAESEKVETAKEEDDRGKEVKTEVCLVAGWLRGDPSAIGIPIT